jgi:hypothetical protein
MRAAEYLVDIGIHNGAARERDIREGLAQERAEREGQRPFYSSHRPHCAKNLTLALTKEFSLRGFECQYRGLSITDCLRCDIKGVELGY